jgi:uncharacterized protein
VTLDWNCGALAKGLACYERGEFFIAHEHWEEVWLALEEPQKSFLQALIQVTAAFHHLNRGNPAGAVSLLRRASQRLAPYPEHFAELSVPPLRAEIAAWIHSIENGAQTFPVARPRLRPVHPA